MWHPILSLMEDRWKLRQKYDGGEAIVQQMLASEEINPKQ